MSYIAHVLVLVGVFALLALALNLLLGYAGLLHLGIAALFGVGAYLSAIFSLEGVPVYVTILIAVLLTGLISVLIGLPSLRVRGDFFALVTLGFGFVLESVMKNWVSVTHGSLGLSNVPHMTIGSFMLTEAWQYALLVAVIVLIVLLLLRLLLTSPFVRLVRAVRDDELVTRSLGKHVWNTKIVVLGLAGLICGLAGALYVHYLTFIDPSSFGITESLLILMIVIIGGLESMYGSVIAAVLVLVIPELLRFVGIPAEVIGPLRQLVFSLVLIMLILYRPQGVAGKVGA